MPRLLISGQRRIQAVNQHLVTDTPPGALRQRSGTNSRTQPVQIRLKRSIFGAYFITHVRYSPFQLTFENLLNASKLHTGPDLRVCMFAGLQKFVTLQPNLAPSKVQTLTWCHLGFADF
jgi:hypothetical protein